MKLGEGISVGFKAIWKNKLRSALTILGIVIGVGSVIAMVSLGDGMKALVMRDAQKVGGINLFIIERPNWIERNNRWIRNPSKEHLTYEDVIALESESPLIMGVTPWVDEGVQISVADKRKPAESIATTPSFQFSRDWFAQFGRFITTADVGAWTKVCVIGVEIWRDLFGQRNPLGQLVRFKGQNFTVVGVMEEKGELFGGWNQDNQFMLPLTTAQQRFRGNKFVDVFWVKISDYERTDEAVSHAELILKRRHNNDGEFFRVFTVKQFLTEIGRISLMIKVMLGGIAGIALLVGGVGIMNIMLVSVTERTQEIGLRKAVGAKRRDILFQFLIEAIILCLIGGSIGITLGILFGFGMAKGVSTFLIKDVNWPSVVSLQSIIMSFGFCAAIGLFFGLYPANKASKLSPVEALRYE
jgi:putative ABC transport system permease protein